MDNNNNNAKRQMFQEAIINEKDFLKKVIEDFCQNLLEEEMEAHIGAKKYERTGDRQGRRNGYKPRMLKTRVGTLNLLIPQDREGNFSTKLFDRYQRSEKALVLALMEMYIKGISTQKVKDITEELCSTSFSSSTVSNLSSKLDSQIKAWKARPLKEEYPILIVDTTYIKARIENSILSQGVALVAGINAKGSREILAVEVINSETFEGYDRIFKDLKARGLKGVVLITSDADKGLTGAVEKNFTGSLWQRCVYHFKKNVLDLVPRKKRAELAADLKSIFSASSKKEAIRIAKMLSEKYAKNYPKVEEMLTVDILDSLTYMDFPEGLRRRIRTTNLIERLNSEIKRRTKVVRIFPNPESADRLISAICMEKNEEWITGNKYLNMEPLKDFKLPKDKRLDKNKDTLVSIK